MRLASRSRSFILFNQRSIVGDIVTSLKLIQGLSSGVPNPTNRWGFSSKRKALPPMAKGIDQFFWMLDQDLEVDVEEIPRPALFSKEIRWMVKAEKLEMFRWYNPEDDIMVDEVRRPLDHRLVRLLLLKSKPNQPAVLSLSAMMEELKGRFESETDISAALLRLLGGEYVEQVDETHFQLSPKAKMALENRTKNGIFRSQVKISSYQEVFGRRKVELDMVHNDEPKAFDAYQNLLNVKWRNVCKPLVGLE
jgi:hypothetical protein